MNEDYKQSTLATGAQSAAGAGFGALSGALTLGSLTAVAGAALGAALQLTGMVGVDVGTAIAAGAGVGGLAGAIPGATAGGIGGLVAGIRNAAPDDNRELAHQQEIQREKTDSFVQGMNTAGIAFVQAQQKENYWQELCKCDQGKGIER